ncbi:hypothetical protein [Chitinophaga arvensicola]|uniref:Uncharacterized protein n=1 Tax=Chitinophaga arvensicola TaxID=29529 RepID=A0A1I0QB19_9BACT|nr:hypothetical protein [Chitinophaga arvensicola]SEW24223.1 hypothetical protein SAMN04488122_1347 [Chitinophaga arvensicola]
MKNIGELSADGYGFAIISTDVLTQYLSDKKVKAKKLISYLDKNKPIFYQMIKDGKMAPFYRISAFEYAIFTTLNEDNSPLPAGYKEIFRYPGFYLEVGDLGRICFASFDYLEYQLADIKANITDKMDEIPSGAAGTLEKYYPAIGMDLPRGTYLFDLVGLKREQELERESKNYAYQLCFREVANAHNDNFEKCDNDKYSFDIDGYEE